MDNSPDASRLVLLSQLPDAPAGIKVRFLGCVDTYDSELAILRLRDRFPATSATSGAANVNVNNVLDVLNVETTQVGAWVNVIGYVRQDTELQSKSKPRASTVDAVLIWSAGAIKLEDYEAAVLALQITAT
ncbi:hypothetical protein Q7P35_012515 [Cladosporium inversicolor]